MRFDLDVSMLGWGDCEATHSIVLHADPPKDQIGSLQSRQTAVEAHQVPFFLLLLVNLLA
jgi:hypothetical protein